MRVTTGHREHKDYKESARTKLQSAPPLLCATKGRHLSFPTRFSGGDLDRNRSATSVFSVCSCCPSLIISGSRALVFEQEQTETTEENELQSPRCGHQVGLTHRCSNVRAVIFGFFVVAFCINLATRVWLTLSSGAPLRLPYASSRSLHSNPVATGRVKASNRVASAADLSLRKTIRFEAGARLCLAFL